MSAMHSEVQRQDWQDRDFIEIISSNIKKIADFLNHFDQSCRAKLAELDDKVNSLERQMHFLEAAVSGACASSQAALAAAAPMSSLEFEETRPSS